LQNTRVLKRTKIKENIFKHFTIMAEVEAKVKAIIADKLGVTRQS